MHSANLGRKRGSISGSVSCGDASKERKAIGAFFPAAGWEDVDGTAAVVGTLKEALVLEIGDVLMHGGEGAEAQSAGDLLVGGRVAVLLREAG